MKGLIALARIEQALAELAEEYDNDRPYRTDVLLEVALKAKWLIWKLFGSSAVVVGAVIWDADDLARLGAAGFGLLVVYGLCDSLREREQREFRLLLNARPGFEAWRPVRGVKTYRDTLARGDP